MAIDPAAVARGLDLIRDGWTWRAAAAETGMAERTLRKHAVRAGVTPSRRPGQRPAADPARVREMYAAGADATTIAARLGVSKTAVLSALDYAGVQRTTRRVRFTRPITAAEADELQRAVQSPDLAVLAAVALRLHAEGVPIAVQSVAAGRDRRWLWYQLRSHGYWLPERDVIRRRKPRPEHETD